MADALIRGCQATVGDDETVTPSISGISGIRVGDQVYVIASCSGDTLGGDSFTAPSHTPAWREYNGTDLSPDLAIDTGAASPPSAQVFTRQVDATDISNGHLGAFTTGSNGNGCLAHVLATVGPTEVDAAGSEGDETSAAPTAPAVTTGQTNTLLAAFAIFDDDADAEDALSYFPAGMVPRGNEVTDFSGVADNGHGAMLATAYAPSSGSQSARDFAIANSEENSARQFSIKPTTSLPRIDDIDTAAAGDLYALDGETGVVLTVANAGASQGTGKVESAATEDFSGTTTEHTVTAWADDEITVTIDRGSVAEGHQVFKVTNDSGEVSGPYRLAVLDAAPTPAFDVVRTALNTGTGTQDITGDLGGATAVGAVLVLGRQTADGIVAHAAIGIGACSGSSERGAIALSSQDNVSTADNNYRTETDECVVLLDPTSGAVLQVEADFSAFIADGVRINVTTAPGSGYLLIAFLIGPSPGAQVEVGNLRLPSGSSPIDVDTDMDHVDALLMFGSGKQVNASGGDWTWNVGLGAFAKTLASGRDHFQSWAGYSYTDGQTTAAPGATLRSGTIIGQSFAGAMWDALAEPIPSHGFRCINIEGDPNDDDAFYVALSLPGVALKGMFYDTPTSTGDDAVTGVGFEPQAEIGVMHHLTAAEIGSEVSDADAGAMGLGFVAGGNEHSISTHYEDEASTINAGTAMEDRAAYLVDDAGTLELAADHSSYDSDGFTKSWTNVAGEAKRWPVLLFGAAPSGGGNQTGAVSEGAVLGDSFGAVATSHGLLSDGLSMGDALAAQSAAQAALLEGGSLGDAVSAQAAALASRADGAALGDAQAAQVAAYGAISEGSVLGDALSGLAVSLASLAEGSVLGDTQDGTATTPVSISEGMVAGDSISAQVASLASVSEGASLGEALTALSATLASLSDGSVLGDSFAGVQSFFAAITEGALLGDQTSARSDASVALSEGFAAGDSVSAQSAALASTTEGAALGDSLLGLSAALGTLTEALEAGDTYAATTAAQGVLAEGAVLSDALSALAGVQVSVSDGTVLSDVFNYLETVRVILSAVATTVSRLGADPSTTSRLGADASSTSRLTAKGGTHTEGGS